MSRLSFRDEAILLVLGLFALAEYGNYGQGRDLSRLCELLGPHGAEVARLRTPR